MRRIKALKYLAALSLPVISVWSFSQSGWAAWSPVLYAFGIVPLLDVLLGEQKENVLPEEQNAYRSDVFFQLLILLTAPAQWFTLFYFLHVSSSHAFGGSDLIGHVAGMGMMCGVIGINVAHELGHRPQKGMQFLAKSMLLTSLYMHFFIEHNRGHHKHVATPNDASTAKRNQSVYAFWWQTITGTFLSAWQIVKKERQRKQLAEWSFGNEMIQYLCIQLFFVLGIGWVYGPIGAASFIGAAAIGAVMLETVNYIEHYGLTRLRVSEHRFEDVQVWHSWNSDHVFGRCVLFELNRHSDHHYDAAKPYQVLESKEQALQLPTGYPGSMLLSLLPPLWFKVMNPRLKA